MHCSSPPSCSNDPVVLIISFNIKKFFCNPGHVSELPLASSSSLPISGIMGRGWFSSQQTFHRLVLAIAWATVLILSTTYSTLRSTHPSPSLKILTSLTSPKLSLTRKKKSLRPESPQHQPAPVIQRPPLSGVLTHSSTKTKGKVWLSWRKTRQSKKLRIFWSLTSNHQTLNIPGRDSRAGLSTYF